MGILSTIPIPSGGKDVRDTLNYVLAQVIALQYKLDVVTGVIPSFSAKPSITTEANALVDSFASFSFGAANAALGAKTLLRNGVAYADASAGSFQFTEAGVYELEVEIGTTGIKSKSNPVTVRVAILGKPEVPVLSNPANFVTGTNPPVQSLFIPQTVDKTKFKLVGQWDYALTGAFTYSASRTFEVADLMAFGNTESADISQYLGQPTGPWRVRVAFVAISDSSIMSDWSNLWSDTLGTVKAVTASGTFMANPQSGAIILSSDKTTIERGSPDGGQLGMRGTYTNEVKTTGKWIAKLRLINPNSTNDAGAVASFGLADNQALGQYNGDQFNENNLRYVANGYLSGNNVQYNSDGKVYPNWGSADDDMWVVFDCDTKKAWFGKNEEWFGGDPTTATGGIPIDYLSEVRVYAGLNAPGGKMKILSLEPFNG